MSIPAGQAWVQGAVASFLSGQLTHFVGQGGSGANLDARTAESAPVLVKRTGRIGAYRLPSLPEDEAHRPNPPNVFTGSDAQPA